MSLVTRYSVSSTAAEDGQRLAAFSIVRSFGITNWSRTALQKRSSGDAGVGGRSEGRGHAVPGVRNGAAPPRASNRAKSRRFIAASGTGFYASAARGRQLFTRQAVAVAVAPLRVPRRLVSQSRTPIAW